MHFIIYAKDKKGALHIRKANREAHLAFLKAQSPVTVCTAGPLLSDDTQMMIGSTLIVEADSLLTVKDWLSQDPYAKAGLTDSLEIHPFTWAIGAPE